MPIRIFTNLSSLITQRALERNNSNVAQNVERVASGIRITRAADDSAGLAISEALRSNTRVLRQAAKNATASVTLLNTAEGALNEVGATLIRLRELASQSSTGTIQDSDRATVQLEFNALKSEMDRIAATTEYNGKKLLDGSLSAATTAEHTTIQLGLNSGASNRIDINATVDLTAITSAALGLTNTSVSTQDKALAAMGVIEKAINSVLVVRGRLGAVQQNLSYSSANINSSIQSFTNADATIRDADMGDEMALLTRNQILVESSTAMIGQSNLIPQSVLQLLR